MSSMYWLPAVTNKRPENPAQLIFRSGAALLTVLVCLNSTTLDIRLSY